MLWDGIFIDYYLSSFEGHLEVVALLINHGAEVTCKDKKGYTPLHAAASNGQINIVKHLLNLGVEVCGNVLPCCSIFEVLFSSLLWMLLQILEDLLKKIVPIFCTTLCFMWFISAKARKTFWNKSV